MRENDRYIARKGEQTLVLSGVRHGSRVAFPTYVVQTHFARAAVWITGFDFTVANKLRQAARFLRHGDLLAISRFLDSEELNVVHKASVRKLNGKASMTAATLGELTACGMFLQLLPSNRKNGQA